MVTAYLVVESQGCMPQMTNSKALIALMNPDTTDHQLKLRLLLTKLYIFLRKMNFLKSLNLMIMLQMTLGCQNGQIPQFNSIEEAIQFAEENDIPLEDLPYRK